jgi:hypothetical protein
LLGLIFCTQNKGFYPERSVDADVVRIAAFLAPFALVGFFLWQVLKHREAEQSVKERDFYTLSGAK